MRGRARANLPVRRDSSVCDQHGSPHESDNSTANQYATTGAAAVWVREVHAITSADAGGSNGYRSRAWKHGRQKFADETRLCVHRPCQPFPAGHEQVEQDRTSIALPQHAQLARQATAYPRDHCRPDRQDANGRGASGQSQARQQKLPDWRSHNERADKRTAASWRRVSRRLELRATSTMKLEMQLRSES